MLKRIIAGVLATGILLAGTSVFACNCGEQYRTYEYNPLDNGSHYVSYSCSYRACDNPFTAIGVEECVPYEYYYDPFDNVSRYRCGLCGQLLPDIYH